MSIITTILNKELNTVNNILNIIWTDCIDNNFKSFINSLGHNLISFNDTYYGCLSPDLIICNNKLQFFENCKMFSIQYHIPILLVDHSTRSNLLDENKIDMLNRFPCCYSVAISQKISESWNNIHNQILSYTKDDIESKNIWKNLIYQTSKITFLM